MGDTSAAAIDHFLDFLPRSLTRHRKKRRKTAEDALILNKSSETTEKERHAIPFIFTPISLFLNVRKRDREELTKNQVKGCY